MSMKAVELQFAIQKNTDAGFAQHQQQQRPVLDQAQLAAQSGRLTEQARHVSAKLDQVSGGKIRERQPESGPKRGSGGVRRKTVVFGETTVSPREPADPYKGRHIDLSL